MNDATASEVLLGFEIPYLPDALAGSLHLTSDEPAEQLAEVLARQVNLVAGLHRWQGAGFSLRYLAGGRDAAIRIGLLVRLPAHLTRDGDLETVGKFIAQLRHYFASHELPLVSVDREAIGQWLEPFPIVGVSEIRQRVQLIHLPTGDSFYTVFPFSQAPTSWIQAMRMLIAQPAPVLLSAFLQPTGLTRSEEQVYAATASEAQGRVQQNFEGKALRLSQSNPQAEIVAKTYAEYLTRLQQPFLGVLQIASPDPDVCGPLAQAIAGEVSPAGGRGVDHSHPSGFDVVVAESPAEIAAAAGVLRTLSFMGGTFGAIRAPDHKERLAFLYDARTAACLFRFPVSIRGGVPGVATRQHAPSQLGPQRGGGDAVFLGRAEGGGSPAVIQREDLKRHTLIAGINGSGKTTTCFQILFELHRLGVPFLVIEPAKHEYRGLIRSAFGRDVRIFTLGDASTSPFRLNPLELQAGVRVEGHISKVLACLLSALPLVGPMPSLLEASLLQVYSDRGWQTIDVAEANDPRDMPTLRDLYFAIIRATEGRGYSASTLSDIQAASAGRLVSFLRGSKGRMLDVRHSTPMADLVSGPVVLELDSLSDEEKALVMLFLVTHLREHLATSRDSDHLQHVTLIEEAHRVMAKPDPGGNREVSGAATAGAVSLMSAALSEVRAYGEGIIIAEQVPGRLVEDALKNTNTKIIHRLPGEDDRDAVGGTMNLEEAQENYVAKLQRGCAAYFGEGMERPVFVEVENVRTPKNFPATEGLPERVSDREVGAHMASVGCGADGKPDLPYPGCLHCRSQCRYRDAVSLIAFEVPMVNRFSTVYERAVRQSDPDPVKAARLAWNDLVGFTLDGMSGIRGETADADRAWCLLSHLHSGKPAASAAALFFELAAADPPELAPKPPGPLTEAEEWVAKARELIKGLF